MTSTPSAAARGHRLARLVGTALAAGVLLGFAGAAAPALAHDELLGSTPEPGQVLETAPDEVLLTFSGDVIAVGSVIEVVDHHGEAVESGETTVLGPEVSAALPTDLSGDYQVRWRVVSSDGHPIEGTIDFGVGSDATGVWESQPPHDGAGEEEAGAQGAGSGEDSADAGDDAAADAPNGWAVAGFVVAALAVVGLVIALIVKATRRTPGGPGAAGGPSGPGASGGSGTTDDRA
ncbi:copper resistance protein CopC [Agromyces sp. CFH 90414]|uniref:Copper resistance protein CopC n=1 Tax=Agromyces agglutinans TaxID=2662258 RepID=A0A6I2FBM7_9MICO|nr:copper resistance CopC family protein [Agromyces agglutinans]MRG59333.1 copper resistance protein CopC [Agromyces agglutinans]